MYAQNIQPYPKGDVLVKNIKLGAQSRSEIGDLDFGSVSDFSLNCPVRKDTASVNVCSLTFGFFLFSEINEERKQLANTIAQFCARLWKVIALCSFL